jgi:hypothetical protein
MNQSEEIVEYLRINGLSVCYSTKYLTDAFLYKQIAFVTETHIAYSEHPSTLETDPEHWYTKCTQNLLLRVQWLDTKLADDLFSQLCTEGVFEVMPITMWPVRPWRVILGDLDKFHLEHDFVTINLHHELLHNMYYDVAPFPSRDEEEAMRAEEERRQEEDDEQEERYAQFLEDHGDDDVERSVGYLDDDDDEGEHYVPDTDDYSN